ncbi:YfiR/HmsC family protein [Oceanihabitans sp. 2_MG-2023]|uniref:YfiR/HmsC family protein n=1 Tax=Oceanihabitans sp. 2_MG-2023 TaxID=3062661 RepID=UPI0026E22465|nr:YfiR/HmsC family protein [Oceanihabitans sp. 2_MG-2023]MDO6597403.1 YfiR/HmsC family protein [Oceanihabitans sp. 2_MG-2023]
MIINTPKFSLNSKSIFAFLLVCFLFQISAQSQEANNEEIKRLQRSIFIFNFTQQVSWSNLEALNQFNIGVLGPDRTIIDLKSLALKRRIFNKPVKVVNFNTVEDIRNIQVLYVNNIYNYDINHVLNKIASKNILLITEDYKYHVSMINMVNAGNSFEYEINENSLEQEGFILAESLINNAITSSEKWKILYQDVNKNLNKTKDTSALQEEIIKNSEKEILDKENVIDTISSKLSDQENWINQLNKDNQLQNKKLEDKVAIENQLEQIINSQLDTLKAQTETIRKSNEKIKIQNDFLATQLQDIEKKKAVLKQNNNQISKLKLFNYLLVALVLLALIACYSIYRMYVTNKKFLKSLKQKNAVIYKQTQELASQNKELEQFAYITSHDLKEPLNTISGLIVLLLEEYEDKLDEDGKMSLNFINESSLRMKTLIDSLLEYSRLGKTKAYNTINTTHLIEAIKTDLGSMISKSKAIITTQNLPTIIGSDIEIRLLFQNLISNGIKFIDPNTTPNITISCIKTEEEDVQEYWQFAVTDNGIGIPENYQDRIFAIFQRLHNREKYEGTGIGLAHCKKIVESHGGKIWLTSKEGIGTTFYFTIPAAV